MPQWLEVVGRFHPLVLHLPIGLLIGLGVLELVALAQRRPAPAEAARLLAWLAGISAVVAGVTGFVLSQESTYSGDTVTTHLWLGIAVAVGAVLVALLHARKLRAPYLACLVLTLALLVPAGHYGGVITHGEGFITEPLQARRSRDPGIVAAVSTQDSSTFAAVVAPIFQARCITCHGSAKHKGGLLLDSDDGILKGGDAGPVLVAGKPDESELVRRLRLPLDDDDHMPPKAKGQPKADEIAAIAAWIAAGAPFEGHIKGIESTGVEPTETVAKESKPTGPAPASAEALAALRERFVHVEPLASDSNLLWIDFAAAPRSTDSDVRSLLEPVRDQVAELSLARCAVTSDLAPVLAKFPNLTRLDLRATAVTDAAVESLKSHPRLEDLILAQTRLTDNVSDYLLAMPALKRVHLWHSGVSPEGAKALRERRPSLEVDLGDQAGAAAVEIEPEIKLTGEAPLPGQSPAAGGAFSLEPINKVCPVSGSPVDPKFAVVHKGRVIGFCCPNCPGQFWADPSKFEAALAK